MIEQLVVWSRISVNVERSSKWTMTLSNTLIKIATLAVLALILASCATLFTTATGTYNISGIEAEARSNGYVFTIKAAGKIGKVEAWVGPGNWLYISIPDTNMDSGKLSGLASCPVVSGMQFFRYPGSVQVTLHLKTKFDHVSVLNYRNDNNVYVVLYKYKE